MAIPPTRESYSQCWHLPTRHYLAGGTGPQDAHPGTGFNSEVASVLGHRHGRRRRKRHQLNGLIDMMGVLDANSAHVPERAFEATGPARRGLGCADSPRGPSTPASPNSKATLISRGGSPRTTADGRRN